MTKNYPTKGEEETNDQRPPTKAETKIAEALNRIEANVRLAKKDLEGDGYETFEYLKNIRTWINAARFELPQVLTPNNEAAIEEDEDDEEEDKVKHYVAFSHNKNNPDGDGDTVYVPALLVDIYGGEIAFTYCTDIHSNHIVSYDPERLTKEQIETLGGTIASGEIPDQA